VEGDGTLQSSYQYECEVKEKQEKQAVPQDALVRAGGVGHEFKEKQAALQDALVHAGGARDKKDMAAVIEANQSAHARGRAAQEARMAEWRLGHDGLVPLRTGKGGKINKAKAKQGNFMEEQAVPLVLVHAGGGLEFCRPPPRREAEQNTRDDVGLSGDMRRLEQQSVGVKESEGEELEATRGACGAGSSGDRVDLEEIESMKESLKVQMLNTKLTKLGLDSVDSSEHEVAALRA
ncbi:unnamed protein product, partial [Prorocentrum cordatum]